MTTSDNSITFNSENTNEKKRKKMLVKVLCSEINVATHFNKNRLICSKKTKKKWFSVSQLYVSKTVCVFDCLFSEEFKTHKKAYDSVSITMGVYVWVCQKQVSVSFMLRLTIRIYEPHENTKNGNQFLYLCTIYISLSIDVFAS